MRREQVFSKGGSYLFAVKTNLMLHHEAAAHGTKAISRMLQSNDPSSPITILDLACGGFPISISEMVETFPNRSFDYTGVDINPDQVQLAKEFSYPSNFHKITILEGDSWNLPSLDLRRSFDIIFIGLNLHHGTPEEIFCLMKQINLLLSKNGIFINHDMYRPSNHIYIRRPDSNPQNASESYILIPQETLAAYNTPSFKLKSVPLASANPDWRLEFLDLYKQILSARGGDQEAVDSAWTHIYQRDFSLSTIEMQHVMEKAGYLTKVIHYDDSNQPLKRYYSMLIASKPQING